MRSSGKGLWAGSSRPCSPPCQALLGLRTSRSRGRACGRRRGHLHWCVRSQHAACSVTQTTLLRIQKPSKTVLIEYACYQHHNHHSQENHHHTHTQANAQLSFQESKEISRGKQIIENWKPDWWMPHNLHWTWRGGIRSDWLETLVCPPSGILVLRTQKMGTEPPGRARNVKDCPLSERRAPTHTGPGTEWLVITQWLQIKKKKKSCPAKWLSGEHRHVNQEVTVDSPQGTCPGYR